MKTIKNIVYTILCSLLFAGCDDIEFLNLERDNPLDGQNSSIMQDGVAIKFDGYSVYSDNNRNGIINKGETVRLNVRLKNTGTEWASGILATFSTTSPHVSGFASTRVRYGGISAGSTIWYQNNKNGYYVIEFTVLASTPVNTQITINVATEDNNNKKWQEDFNVTVQ